MIPNFLLSFLDQVLPLHSLQSGFTSQLLAIARVVKYRKAEFWLAHAPPSEELGIVLRGTLMQFRYDNNQQRVMQLWNKSDYLIDGSILMPKPHAEERIIFLENSELILLPIAKIRQLEASYPAASQLVATLVNQRIAQLQEQLFSQRFQSPKMRLAFVLQHHKRAFYLLTSQQKASYIGISKQSLYTILQDCANH
ncbi:Crp/Fnr family transcriptional regulator [Sphingobacterium oryzagri]|uniref:Crp/Fnr family transcriptional regulator n=1 Tax=Sphingobacterium oryzagri TaxID=3025669 RepID=A0ABY7WEZ4_9SPHI|nr:Crp/Fnr family transcriptional regulator [Sphingobacterium sp. KACC 22765]WDF67179.1 Crp/Fnr family transcriptional regulator [Sphingobacterium sp. KACC 22765]